MNWMEFVAALVGHFAWPISILVIFLVLRHRISRLIEQLARLKYKDLELDFEKVRQHAEVLRETPTPQLPTSAPAPEARLLLSLNEQIVETAERAPAAAVILAWSSLESALAAATARLAASPETPSYRSAVHNIELLEREGQLSRNQVDLLHELRALRNKIAHDSDAVVKIAESQALEYSSAARSLAEFLNGLQRVYKLVEPAQGEWIERPENFRTVETKSNANVWVYSHVQLPDTGLTAGVGPWKNGIAAEDKFVHYGIDIEMPTQTGERVIAELRFGLEFVAPGVLGKKAHDIVRFDAQSRIVTFDLGHSVFRFQIH